MYKRLYTYGIISTYYTYTVKNIFWWNLELRFASTKDEKWWWVVRMINVRMMTMLRNDCEYEMRRMNDGEMRIR